MVWYTNMVAVLLFWDANIAAVKMYFFKPFLDESGKKIMGVPNESPSKLFHIINYLFFIKVWSTVVCKKNYCRQQ